MTERRYTDDEVAAIFERASKTEHAALPVAAEQAGMTLAALQEIGQEVGIAPEMIARAARSLDVVGTTASRTYLGLPIGVGRVIEFDRPLSETDWERLVGDLRETFGARGAVRYDGPFRQWTNGNLQALLEPTANGHRLRLQTVKGDSRSLMTGGIAMLVVSAGTWIVLTIAGGAGQSGSAGGVGFMALMGSGMFTLGALRIPAWARRRRMQIEAVTARLVSLSSETPPLGTLAGGKDSSRTI